VDDWAGKPLVLEPWQEELFGEALRVDEQGRLVWRSLIVVAPRKNGKTVMLAAYALWRLLRVRRGQPEILLAAASDRQAGRLFDAVAAFCRLNTRLSGLVRVRDYAGEVVREDGGGKILRVASDPARLHGYNPSLVVCDELAQWTTPSLRRAYAALTSAGGARRSPQVVSISTAGSAETRRDSILGRILDEALACGDVTSRPGLSICRMHEARTLVWAYEAPTRDPRDVAAMKLANPASWVTEEFLRRQAENPELSDADVLQLHGCVWAETDRAWLPADAWDACGSERRLVGGERVVLGCDGSYRRDSTALVACTLDGHVQVVGLWERPDWAGDDWAIPRSEVAATLEEAMETYEVLELACDPPGWHAEIDEWRDTWGDVVVDFPTNERRRMSAACDRFRSAVVEGRLSHDGDPRLARHVAACAAKETPAGTVITKLDRSRRIDAAVAAVVAYERAMWRAKAAEARPWLAVW